MTAVSEPQVWSDRSDRPHDRSRLGSVIEALLYEVGVLAAGVVPPPVSRRALSAVAEAMYRLNPPRVRFLRQNTAAVAAQFNGRSTEELVHAAVLSRAGGWFEFLRIPSMTNAEIRALTDVEGIENLHSAVDTHGAAVLGLLHSRNLDFTMIRLAPVSGPLWMPSGHRGSSHVRRRVRAERCRRDIRYLPAGGGRGSRFEFLLDALRSGQSVVVVTDVVNDGVGLPVSLLGRVAIMSTGAAALASAAHAPLIPVVSWSEGERVKIRVHRSLVSPSAGPWDTVTLTQEIADVFSETIRQHPEDWHGLWEHVWHEPNEPTRGAGRA